MGVLQRWDDHNQSVLEQRNAEGSTWEEWNDRQELPGPAWLWMVHGLPLIGMLALPVLVVLQWRHRRQRSGRPDPPASSLPPG